MPSESERNKRDVHGYRVRNRVLAQSKRSAFRYDPQIDYATKTAKGCVLHVKPHCWLSLSSVMKMNSQRQFYITKSLNNTHGPIINSQEGSVVRTLWCDYLPVQKFDHYTATTDLRLFTCIRIPSSACCRFAGNRTPSTVHQIPKGNPLPSIGVDELPNAMSVPRHYAPAPR
ncbi:hypothetical protein QTP88_005137 [Uroleucon formosanum]